MNKTIFLLILVTFSISPLLSSAQDLTAAVAFSGTGDMRNNKTAVDAQGNIYTTGYFVGTVDFDPSPTGTVSFATNSSSSDIFITKVSSTGSLIWAKRIGSAGTEVGKDIAVDGNGNVIVTGHYASTVDFNPGTAVNNLYSPATDTDIFLLKLDSDGNYVSAFTIGESGTQMPEALTIDDNNNILITGYFHGSVNFNPSGSAYLSNISSSSNIFIAKYTNTGAYVWAKSIGILSYVERGHDIATDVDGNVYVTGNFNSTVDFNPGTAVSNLTSSTNATTYVLKLNSSGNFVWVKQSGGLRGYSIAVDQEKSVYIIGDFWNPTDFDLGSGVLTLSSETSGYSCFLSKYDSTGNFLWTQLVSNESVYPTTIQFYSLATDNQNNIYLAGAYAGTFDFDPSADSTKLTSNGGIDAFVSKKDKNGNLIWAISMGGPTEDQCTDIAIQPNGKLVVVGNFTGTADFNPLATASNNLTSAGSNDAFIAVLNNTMFPLIFNEHSLEAYLVSSGIEIHWENIYTQYDKFTAVQRSDDGIHFYSIGKINIETENIGTKKDYYFIDKNPKQGINFYRLMDEDIDGKFSFSNVVQVQLLSTNDISIYPNPAKTQLFINSAIKYMDYQIENNMGQVMQKGKVQANEAINLQNLSIGLYFIKTGNKSFKFIKE